eukprot:CAMPEP_0197192918 /NCGR_PEP_ID=MMETSP1423-20130617/26047_1 /TAXON_ID=476441 /ORGANISM="Pseudo-nitzschia heimii, Strain UNC1101" /LENGTH=547 /DNA_ID=CAMNT_0042645935 /DNA_START=131 /DNA_END=1774 /DNA_ORIENTATION=+
MINENDQSVNKATSNKRGSSLFDTAASDAINEFSLDKSVQQSLIQNAAHNQYGLNPIAVRFGPKQIIDQSISHQLMVDSADAEREWARELYEMNSDMREDVNYELHGVRSRAIPEDQTSLSEALRLFQIEIDTKIPPAEKQAYIRAVVGLKSNYVQTSEFRLRFLRAERFDIRKAAIRFCRALDYLVQSFGEQALLRQLFLSDLSKEEERFLRKGFKQILPSRDRFGRRLLVHFGSYGHEYSFKVRSKVVTYLCFGVLAEDLTTQRNGVVSMGFFSVGDNDLLILERKGFHQFFDAVPLRWSGFHLCMLKNSAFKMLKGLFLRIIPKDMRRITRVHFGTSLECEYSLRCFGIPIEDIPRTCTGKIKTKFLVKWVKIRTAMDDHRRMMAQNNYNSYYARPPSARAFPGIECPEVNCVLFRLAGLAATHPGNVEFRLFLQEKEIEREKLKTLKQKEDHLNQIIKEMALRGLRFLVFDENCHWYNEITDYSILRNHVFKAQRGIGKRIKARTSMQLAKSNTAVFSSLDGFASNPCEQNCGTTKKKNKRLY